MRLKDVGDATVLGKGDGAAALLVVEAAVKGAAGPDLLTSKPSLTEHHNSRQYKPRI